LPRGNDIIDCKCTFSSKPAGVTSRAYVRWITYVDGSSNADNAGHARTRVTRPTDCRHVRRLSNHRRLLQTVVFQVSSTSIRFAVDSGVRSTLPHKGRLRLPSLSASLLPLAKIPNLQRGSERESESVQDRLMRGADNRFGETRGIRPIIDGRPRSSATRQISTNPLPLHPLIVPPSFPLSVITRRR